LRRYPRSFAEAVVSLRTTMNGNQDPLVPSWALVADEPTLRAHALRTVAAASIGETFTAPSDQLWGEVETILSGSATIQGTTAEMITLVAERLGGNPKVTPPDDETWGLWAWIARFAVDWKKSTVKAHVWSDLFSSPKSDIGSRGRGRRTSRELEPREKQDNQTAAVVAATPEAIFAFATANLAPDEMSRFRQMCRVPGTAASSQQSADRDRLSSSTVRFEELRKAGGVTGFLQSLSDFHFSAQDRTRVLQELRDGATALIENAPIVRNIDVESKALDAIDVDQVVDFLMKMHEKVTATVHRVFRNEPLEDVLHGIGGKVFSPDKGEKLHGALRDLLADSGKWLVCHQCDGAARLEYSAVGASRVHRWRFRHTSGGKEVHGVWNEREGRLFTSGTREFPEKLQIFGLTK
jgi:hypothetical protein